MTPAVGEGLANAQPSAVDERHHESERWGGRLRTAGVEPVSDTPEEFAAFIAVDTKRYANVVQIAHVQVAVSPLFDVNPFDVCGQMCADGQSVKLWAKNHDASRAMEATASIR